MLGYLEKQNPHWFSEEDPYMEKWAGMRLTERRRSLG